MQSETIRSRQFVFAAIEQKTLPGYLTADFSIRPKP